MASARNLEGLTVDVAIESANLNPQSSLQASNSTLEKIPSFSVYNSRDGEEEEDDGGGDGLERSVTIGDSIRSASGDFSFSDGKRVNLIDGIEEIEENASGSDEGVETVPLFLARGLGIDTGDLSSVNTGGGSPGANVLPVEDSSGGGDGSDMENSYKRMVAEDPCNPLYLRNYAQFLYQSKGDLERAEEYYSRAILVDPRDGELLSQYAKLIWEQHHDHERALSYFEQAAEAAPEDSHVLAAYASFLWETEEEEEDSGSSEFAGAPTSYGTLASAGA